MQDIADTQKVNMDYIEDIWHTLEDTGDTEDTEDIEQSLTDLEEEHMVISEIIEGMLDIVEDVEVENVQYVDVEDVQYVDVEDVHVEDLDVEVEDALVLELEIVH